MTQQLLEVQQGLSLMLLTLMEGSSLEFRNGANREFEMGFTGLPARKGTTDD